ncbi:hypothetical protein Tco_0813869, partial [Tanacetum coccineum]
SGPRCQDTILGVQKLKFDFRLHLNKSYDPPLSRVNTLRSREDNMKLKELMEFCTKLSVRALEFWATTKAKSVNGERQIQALVDKKKLTITEKSVRSNLMLEDVKGIECLPNDVIFEQLTLMGAKTTAWNEFSSTMASAIICLATNQKFNFSKYIFNHMMKNLEGEVKFLMYLRFVQVFLDKQVEGISKHKGIYVTPSHTKKIFANVKREGKCFSRRITPLLQTMIVQAPEDIGEDSAAPTDSYSTPIITQLSSSKPQKKKPKRKQRKDSGPTEPIPDEANNKEPISTPSYEPPQNTEDRLQLTELMNLLTLIDETQERSDEEMLFDVQDDLQGEEIFAEQEVAEKEVSAADLVTTTSATITIDELTLAQTLIEIKAAKPKAVTTSATTITTAIASTRPMAKGIVFHDQEEQASAFTPIKKDQIALDEELALRLHAKEQAELEKERVAQEEASRVENIEELDSIQAMIEAGEQLAARLQAKEQE